MITPRKKVTHFGQLIGGCPICGYELHYCMGTHYRTSNFGNAEGYLRCDEGHDFRDEAMQEILENCGFERTDRRAEELMHDPEDTPQRQVDPRLVLVNGEECMGHFSVAEY